MAGRRWAGVVLALALTVGACGGGGEDDAGKRPAAGARTPTTEAAGGNELPMFVADFKRVCTTQVGFPGAASYEPVPGVHPMVFFTDFRGEGFVNSSGDFPEGWVVEDDGNFKDNTELAAVQLVVCSDRVKETPNGTQCEFDDDGKKLKLELVDSVHDVTVFTASTGKEVGKVTLEAASSTCPYVAAFRKGDTTYVNEPSDDQYIAAVKTFVAP